MKKMILVGLLMASSFAFANMDGGVVDVDGDISAMIHSAGLAVQDHAVKVVGMDSSFVKVAYNYSTGLFTAEDTHQNCSFNAKTTMSMRRLSSGHHWKVTEVGTNTCR